MLRHYKESSSGQPKLPCGDPVVLCYTYSAIYIGHAQHRQTEASIQRPAHVASDDCSGTCLLILSASAVQTLPYST